VVPQSEQQTRKAVDTLLANEIWPWNPAKDLKELGHD
jgi:hypothetical protein